jgi:hypothetical protein
LPWHDASFAGLLNRTGNDRVVVWVRCTEVARRVYNG